MQNIILNEQHYQLLFTTGQVADIGKNQKVSITRTGVRAKVVQTQIYLKDKIGRLHPFLVDGFDLPFSEDNVLTVVFAIKGQSSQGVNLAIINHSIDLTSYHGLFLKKFSAPALHTYVIIALCTLLMMRSAENHASIVVMFSVAIVHFLWRWKKNMSALKSVIQSTTYL